MKIEINFWVNKISIFIGFLKFFINKYKYVKLEVLNRKIRIKIEGILKIIWE